MKKYLGLFLIICLVSLSLPTQVAAGECVSFIEERNYADTIRPDSMIAYGAVSYLNFKSNYSDIPYHNATLMDAYMNIQANGSIRVDVYRTYLNDNISHIAYELMEEILLIAQPVVGLNASIALPYLNGYVLYGEGEGTHFWTSSIILLITSLENYTIYLEITARTYWNVYLIDDSVSTETDTTETTETDTTETTEQSGDETETPTTTTSNITVGNNGVSIWTVIISVIVIAESVMIVVLGHLIRGKWKEMASGRSNYLFGSEKRGG